MSPLQLSGILHVVERPDMCATVCAETRKITPDIVEGEVDALLMRQHVRRPDSLSGLSACEELCAALVCRSAVPERYL
jgi:hypothetical protein